MSFSIELFSTMYVSTYRCTTTVYHLECTLISYNLYAFEVYYYFEGSTINCCNRRI